MLASVCTDSVQTASFAQFTMAAQPAAHDSVEYIVITASTTTTVWPEEKGTVVNAYDTAEFRSDRMRLAPESEPEHGAEHGAEHAEAGAEDGPKDEAEDAPSEVSELALALPAAAMVHLTRACWGSLGGKTLRVFRRENL
jgi:hypothetical protein